MSTLDWKQLRNDSFSLRLKLCNKLRIFHDDAPSQARRNFPYKSRKHNPKETFKFSCNHADAAQLVEVETGPRMAPVRPSLGTKSPQGTIAPRECGALPFPTGRAEPGSTRRVVQDLFGSQFAGLGMLKLSNYFRELCIFVIRHTKKCQNELHLAASLQSFQSDAD